MKKKNKIYDLIIIGFGVSGIALTAKAQESKLDYLVLEKNRELGGVWFDTNKNTSLQSEKRFYQFSDFNFPERSSKFPSKLEVIDYLKSYIKFKCLDQSKIKFNTIVNTATFDENQNLWIVNKELKSKYLGCCNGYFSNNKEIRKIQNKLNLNHIEFNKILNNSNQLHNILNNKNILIHGNGATACDIVDIITTKPFNCKSVTVKIKKDKFYFPKYLWGISLAFIVNKYVLKVVKYFPDWFYFIVFNIFEMLYFNKRVKTFIPYSKINYKNIVGKTVLNKKEVTLGYYMGEWENNLYDVHIWATGSKSLVYNIFPQLKMEDNYLFIYNKNINNCGFIGFAPSYNWLQVSEKQSNIFIKNIVNNTYPSKKKINNWLKKRKLHVKKFGISFNDLTYESLDY